MVQIKLNGTVKTQDTAMSILTKMAPFAETYISELCYRDSKALEYIFSEYEYERKNGVGNSGRSDRIFRDFVDQSENPGLFMKAYFSSIPLRAESSLQRKVFTLFDGEEFELHFLNFVNQIEAESESRVYSITPNFTLTKILQTIIDNELWNFDKAVTLLDDSSLDNVHKEKVVSIWCAKVHTDDKTFLTGDEVNLIIKTSKEYRFSAWPTIPSIRNLHNLDGLPDEWVAEVYFDRRFRSQQVTS